MGIAWGGSKSKVADGYETKSVVADGSRVSSEAAAAGTTTETGSKVTPGDGSTRTGETGVVSHVEGESCVHAYQASTAPKASRANAAKPIRNNSQQNASSRTR